MRFNSWYLTHISFLPNQKTYFSFDLFLMENCVHLYPYQTIADFFKTTTTGFFYLLKILYIANIVFFILKIYSVLWNKQKPVQNHHLLSKLAFYDHLVFTRKQTKRWNRLKQNLLHVENWTGLSRQLEEVKSSRRCRLSQFRFRSPCVEVTGVLFCSACSLLEPLAIM